MSTVSLVNEKSFQRSGDVGWTFEGWRVAAVASLRVQVASIMKNNFILNMEKHRFNRCTPSFCLQLCPWMTSTLFHTISFHVYNWLSDTRTSTLNVNNMAGGNSQHHRWGMSLMDSSADHPGEWMFFSRLLRGKCQSVRSPSINLSQSRALRANRKHTHTPEIEQRKIPPDIPNTYSPKKSQCPLNKNVWKMQLLYWNSLFLGLPCYQYVFGQFIFRIQKKWKDLQLGN